MNVSTRVIVLILILIGTCFYSVNLIHAAELKDAEQTRTDSKVGMEFLSVGLVTGACGVLQAQHNYATMTGNETAITFIKKFMEAEARRLKITMVQYVDNCKRKDALYLQYSRMLQQMARSGGVINVK